MPQAIWYTTDPNFMFNTVPDTITNWYTSVEMDTEFNGQQVFSINVRFNIANPNDYQWVMNQIKLYFEEHNGDDFIRLFPAEIIY